MNELTSVLAETVDPLPAASESSPSGAGQFSFEAAPFDRAQLGVVVLAVLLSALDGYDALSMSFAAPSLSAQWALGKTTVGVLLSSGLMGMAAGSLCLSPFADVVGRKPMLLCGLSLMTIGSLLSALCQTAPELVACRVVTGLGIGLMVALTTSIAAEFVSIRNRPMAVAATTVGFSLGGVTGGLTAAALLQSHSWTWIFVGGAAASLILLLLTVLRMPESPLFIVGRRAPDALVRLNRVLARLGRPQVVVLPPAPVKQRASYRALFGRELLGVTVRYTTVFALVATTSYYMISWLPQLVADAGFPPSTASLVSAISGLVGVVAAFALGAFARIAGPAKVASGGMIGLAAALACFGFSPSTLPALIIASSAFGFFLSGSTAVLFATVTSAFPPMTRVSGVGFVMGTGRVLSAAGPTVAGWMFALGLTRGEVSLVFAACSLLGSVLVVPFSIRRRPG